MNINIVIKAMLCSFGSENEMNIIIVIKAMLCSLGSENDMNIIIVLRQCYAVWTVRMR